MKQAIILLAIGIQGLAQAETKTGSGKIIEETRTVGAFTELSVSTGLHAAVTPGNTVSVKIKGDDNIVPLVETEVEGGELKIRMKKGSSVRSSKPIEVSITSPGLKKISASGGSHLSSSSSLTDDFSLESSGGSHVTLKDLNAKTLDVDASGGSFINVQGKANKLVFEGSGGTHLQADDLQVADSMIDASGGTQVHVKKAAKIKADISGGSRVYAEKSANVEVEKSGGSEVVKE